MKKVNLIKEESGITGIASVTAKFSSLTEVNSHFLPDCVGTQFGLDGDNLNIGAEVEAWERLCLFKSNSQDFASKEINKTNDIYDIEKCILYSENQESDNNFLYAPRLEFGRLVPVVSAIDNKSTILIPRHYIYPRQNLDKKDTSDGWTTNGGAAHISIEKSIHNGIFELIERDSVMCSWASHSNTHRIDLCDAKNNNKRLQKILNLLYKSDLELELFAIINDIKIVTVVAILVSKYAPFLSFGTSCKIDLIASLEHAIFEAVMIRKTQLSLLAEKVKLNELKGLRRHIMSPIENGPGIANWLLDIESRKSIGDLFKIHPKNERLAIDRVFGNFDVFYKLIDIQNASSVGKIYIVKCAMPQLHPLEVSTQIVHEDFRRVHQFCSNKTDLKGNLLIHPYG